MVEILFLILITKKDKIVKVLFGASGCPSSTFTLKNRKHAKSMLNDEKSSRSSKRINKAPSNKTQLTDNVALKDINLYFNLLFENNY
jgi:hypothetical protein